MTRIAGTLRRARLNKPIRFREFVALIEAAGFQLKRQSSSHRMYKSPTAIGHLNIQSDGRDAKPYQVISFSI